MNKNTLALLGVMISLVLPLDVFYDSIAWGAENHQPTKEHRDEARPKNHAKGEIVLAEVTAYCGKKDRLNGGDISSFGKKLKRGDIAASFGTFPPDTELQIDGINWNGTVVDQTGDWKEHPDHIDLYTGPTEKDCQEAMRIGRRKKVPVRIIRKLPKKEQAPGTRVEIAKR